jgi:hypothetical protein
MSELVQWEYRVKTFGSFFKGVQDDSLAFELNQWGEEGWEVVGFRMIENSNQAQIVAKRPLTREVRRQRSMP